MNAVSTRNSGFLDFAEFGGDVLLIKYELSSLEITSLIHFSVFLIDTDPLGREYALDLSIVTGG